MMVFVSRIRNSDLVRFRIEAIN